MGWVPAELTPALWRFVEPGNDCCLSTIVDDLLFTELHGNSITQRTIQGINAHIAAPMTVNEWPHEHAGYCIEYFYELEPPAVKLSMPEYATALARRWLPRLVDGERVKGLLHGTELQRAHGHRDAQVAPRQPQVKKRRFQLEMEGLQIG